MCRRSPPVWSTVVSADCPNHTKQKDEASSSRPRRKGLSSVMWRGDMVFSGPRETFRKKGCPKAGSLATERVPRGRPSVNDSLDAVRWLRLAMDSQRPLSCSYPFGSKAMQVKCASAGGQAYQVRQLCLLLLPGGLRYRRAD